MVRNKMAFLFKPMLLLLVLFLYISSIVFVKAEDSSADNSSPPYLCLNCSHCSSPCQPFPPLPPYPFYEAPPPPPPFDQGYGEPPPPPPPSPVECPPTPAHCCQNATPQGSASTNLSGSTNLPYYNYNSASSLLPTFHHRIYGSLFSILLFFSHFDL